MSTALASQHATVVELPNKAYMLPESIPLWPPAWWTWLVLASIILMLVGLILVWLQRRKKSAYRREAINTITKTHKQLDDKGCILLCHEMVRRCLKSENKNETAALPSQTLFNTLDKTLPKQHQFSSIGTEFIEGPYRHHIELTPQQRTDMIRITCYWIRKHHA